MPKNYLQLPEVAYEKASHAVRGANADPHLPQAGHEQANHCSAAQQHLLMALQGRQ